MRIRELTLRPFRNFDQIHLSFEGDYILISGDNGCGKSNILEAISYLSIGKSVRGAKDHQAIPWEGDYFDIRALCCDGRCDRELRLFYSRKSGKKVFCDEAPLPRVSDVLGIFKTVHFSPEDVSLVLRFPAQRRRLLDILISQSNPQYLRDLQRYQRILAQRNHLLKSERKGSGRASEVSLGPWSEQLIETGARLRAQRLKALSVVEGLFSQYYGRFAHSGEKASVEYRASVLLEEDRLEEGFREELERKKDRERDLGYTVCGPHRDDLFFALGSQPADIYASEGQLKTILIAWKLAEVRFLEYPEGNSPLLLLDDAFSELDPRRIRELLEILDEFEQVLLTTPSRPEGPDFDRFVEIRIGT